MRDYFTKQQMKSLMKKGFKVKKPSRYYVTMVRDLLGNKIDKDFQVDYPSFREVLDSHYECTPFMTLGEVLDRIPREIMVDYVIYKFEYNVNTDGSSFTYVSDNRKILFGYENSEDPMKALFHFVMDCLDIKYKKWFKI